jgi:hypothetical protein
MYIGLAGKITTADHIHTNTPKKKKKRGTRGGGKERERAEEEEEKTLMIKISFRTIMQHLRKCNTSKIFTLRENLKHNVLMVLLPVCYLNLNIPLNFYVFSIL